MKELKTIPKSDGFRMPGEFEKHKGCIMIWPKRPGSWTYGAKKAREAFKNVAEAISESEEVYMLVESDVKESAKNMLSDKIKIIEIESDDAWARDTAPTFVVNDKGDVRGVCWKFNAWGGEYDGLYKNWDKDSKLASSVCEKLGYETYDAKHFVLEGGSIHSDGEGTVIVTEACLLSKGRNPNLSKLEIEDNLKKYLGAEKIIWLKHGIYNDETNEHIDNVCAFVEPASVVLAWTDDEEDEQYKMSKECYDILSNETDAKGRKFKITKLPIPKKHICITEEELAGFEFEEGEDMREVNERLAASYVNFYIANNFIIVPQFNDENDKLAVEILGNLFKDRKIVPIYARDIIVGGGNIHCITQQIPE